jgi:hypothetical protein
VSEVAFLQELLVSLKARERVVSTEGVFREAFPGLDYARVGANGLVFGTAVSGAGAPGSEATAAAPAGSK